MIDFSKKYSNLKEILGLIHQDWEVMFEWEGVKPSYQTALKKLKTASTNEERKNIIVELKELIASNFAEELLREIVNRDFRSAFYPPGAGLTYQQWLKEVLQIMEEPIEKTTKEFLPKFVGEKQE